MSFFLEVLYNDKVLKFEKTFSDLQMGLKDTNYKYNCPICSRKIMLSMHEVFVDDKKCKMTVTPSIVCPYSDCNWHVWIKNGVAIDC